MTPNVSVIVISWNDATRLVRAITSVTGQSLAALEVIVVDDCSTDDTEQVVARLMTKDSRIRYHRLPENSGGCSAPRNAGIELADAPYVMFLDSDDELPYHACKSLLRVMEETGVDFVTGCVDRYFEETGQTRRWYPDLFRERKVIEGIAAEPRYLFDHLSTNKMYRRDFIERHNLRFPLGVHWEDQLWSAKAYCLAERFAAVPWSVYRWWYAGEGTSISSNLQSLQSLEDRISIARMIDDFIVSTGHAHLRQHKDFKFLRHDLKIYLADLWRHDSAWTAKFAERVVPYLEGIAPEAFLRLNRFERICIHLLRRGRLADAAESSRHLRLPTLPAKAVVRQDGKVFWGLQPPSDETDRRELDITRTIGYSDTLSYAKLWHEVEEWSFDGPLLRLRVRTRDPGDFLRDRSWKATLRLQGSRASLEVPVAMTDDDGSYVGEATVDLRRIPVRWRGIDGSRNITMLISSEQQEKADQVRARAEMPEQWVRVGFSQWLSVSSATGAGGRIGLTWRRTWPRSSARFAAPVRKDIRKRLQSSQLRAAVYRALIRVVRVDRNLAFFEAQEGREYGDNPKYVYEELRRRKPSITAVWSKRSTGKGFPPELRTVRRGSWRYIWTLARAAYWVDSHYIPVAYPKRRETRYLQTWHGQTLKSIGFDVPSLKMATPEKQELHRRDVARWDAIVSPSVEYERTFPKAHGFTGEILRTGYPRNDVLVRHAEPDNQARAAAARQRLGIPKDKKVMLYAPTFRQFGENAIRINLADFAEMVAEDWVVVVRSHPYTRLWMPGGLDGVLKDGRAFGDVNDLLLAADVLVTDYSSIMFDFANTGRPILFYVDDYEAYKQSERGTYYDLREIAPGPLLTTMDDLVTALDSLDAVVREHDARYRKFQEMFCSVETGSASALVVDAFFREEAK